MLLLVIDVSLRVTAAAAAVALVLLAFRVRSGSVRHAAWSAVLVVMLTMPLLMAIVPEIEVPVPSTPVLDLGTIASGPFAMDAPVAPGTVTFAPGTAGDAPPLTAVGVPPAPVDWSAIAAGGYAAITALLLLRLAAGWWLARRMVRAATPVRISNGCTILTSSLVSAPLTAGVLRPSIVLPTEWTEWPEFTLRAVLAHENAHVARRDPLVALIARVNRAIFWFHPLAWWLERTIAIAAEHAADERAVREEQEAGAYARVLLAFAESVSRRGSRVAWQALGVDGTGLLGVRIDRLLRGDAVARMSAVRRVTTALACAVVLVVAIACRQQVAATPLTEDPEVARQLAAEAEETRKFQGAINLTLEQVDTLEARLAADPQDVAARGQLVTYYSASTKVPWERKVPGLRRHALWIIEHAPEGPVAPPVLSPQYDPAGFAEARRLWDRHLAGSDVSAFLIYRAARFFWPHDKTTAEALVQRGRAEDPDGSRLRASLPPNVGLASWHAQLADLYASALLGHTNPMTRSDAEPSTSPLAQDVRHKLERSTDADLLARVAGYLTSMRVPKTVELGRHYLDRALALDPASERAVAVKNRTEARERQDRLAAASKEPSTLTGGDRLAFFARQAQQHYIRLEYFDFQVRNGAPDRDASGRQVNYPALIAERETAARNAAQEALALAEQNAGMPDAGHAILAAHHTLGLLALREGDREAAVRHMLDSVKLPPLQDADRDMMLWLKLTNYLLKEGERESVIQFLEQYAKISPANRERLLADAQAIREGRMPRSYQTMFARPEPR